MANSNDVLFTQNRLLLEPTEASFLDLILLLLCSDIRSRKFIDCHDEHRLRDFSHRWIIFISVLVQKILFLFRKPLAMIGYAFEKWCLNFLLCNGGLFNLLLNSLKGKVVKPPDRSSTKFTSLVGNFDLRVGLDNKLRPGDSKYDTSLSLMAAKLAYENGAFIESVVNDHWNMRFLGFYDFCNERQRRASAQAFMLQNTKAEPNLIVLAFRGTHPFNAEHWCMDVDLSWYEFEGVGQIHRGFMRALGLQKNGWPREIERGDRLCAYYALRRMLRDILLKDEKAKFIVTGHGLGGALAILFAAVLAMHDEAELLERLEGVYTFGQPRVGDEKFGEFMTGKLKSYQLKYLRCVYCNDFVPRVPFDVRDLYYKQFWDCIYYNSCYGGKILLQEPKKNYSLLWSIAMHINAVWELIRSFIIPCLKGPSYREGWFMRLARIIGLAFPGLSAHTPLDYNNSIRLGSWLREHQN